VRGGEVPAAPGGSGLDEDGPALGRGRDVQRSARAKEAPVVVEAVDLRGVGENARLAVHHQGVVVPALPEAIADVDELVGPLVAQVVIGGLGGMAERLVAGGGGREVSPPPAPGAGGGGGGGGGAAQEGRLGPAQKGW